MSGHNPAERYSRFTNAPAEGAVRYTSFNPTVTLTADGGATTGDTEIVVDSIPDTVDTGDFVVDGANEREITAIDRDTNTVTIGVALAADIADNASITVNLAGRKLPWISKRILVERDDNVQILHLIMADNSEASMRVRGSTTVGGNLLLDGVAVKVIGKDSEVAAVTVFY